MRVLVDTQVWLWALVADARLGTKARALLASPKNEPLFSAASAWEIAIKYRIGRLSLPDEPERFIPARLARDRFGSLPIDVRHAARVSSLPDHHRDPFDRLLVAQAQIEDLPLLTADRTLSRYDITIIPAAV